MSEGRIDQQYKAIIRGHLEQLREKLVVALSEIASAEQPADMYLLDFEAQPGGFSDEFPVVYFPMDRYLTQLELGKPLLPEIHSTIPEAILEHNNFEAAGVDTWDVAFKVLAEWFAECWKQAGGLNCQYPAYICKHDSIGDSYDLRANRWAPYVEKWPPDD
jgi:hypothetical protein